MAKNELMGQVWFTECGHGGMKIPVEFHSGISQKDGEIVVDWLARFGMIYDHPMKASAKGGMVTVTCYDFKRDNFYKDFVSVSLINTMMERAEN